MNLIGLKIMLTGGHFVTDVVTTELAAKVVKNFRDGTLPGRVLYGQSAVQGVPWEWAVNVKDIVGVHTFVPPSPGQPALGPLGSGLN